MAVSYGSALALIVDEFALLLDLRDVYWARQGRISIDLGIGGSAVAGSYSPPGRYCGGWPVTAAGSPGPPADRDGRVTAGRAASAGR